MRSLKQLILEKEKSKLQSEYEKFFKEKLDKYGVESPAELSDEDKKKFFSEVESGWNEGKGVNEASNTKKPMIEEEEEEDESEDMEEEEEEIDETDEDSDEIKEKIKQYKKLKEELSAFKNKK